MASPTPRSGIVPVAAAQGRYASQGMISPVEPSFVDPTTGVLAPVSFRFLYGLFHDIQVLQQSGGGGGGGTPGPPGPPGPSGPPGSAATVAVGTTTTGAPGTPANVTNSGTAFAATFNFTIPEGVAGATGATGSQGPQGNPGATGNQGPPGNTGATGAPGAAATIAAGTTTTGAPGTSASVANSGSSSAAVFDFTIPQGQTGAAGSPGATGSAGPPGSAATVAVGTTTTGAAGSAANVTNSGSSSAAVFNFTIPQGIQGATGPQGPNWQVGAGLALNTGTTPNTIAMQSPTPASIPKAGVSDGSNAAAGQVGEVISSVVTSSVSLSASTVTSVANISVTAGDWDISGEVWVNNNGVALSTVQAGIGTSGTTAPNLSLGTALAQVQATSALFGTIVLGLSPCRVSLTATTTYFLVAMAAFSGGGPPLATGKIYARRIR